MPTQPIRNLQLAQGDPGAFLDLSNRQSSSIGENIPTSSGNFSRALQDLMTKYSQPYYQSREATLGVEQEQARRGYEPLPEDIRRLELSPSQQREFRGARKGELQPTISGREEREKVYLGQIENVSKFLTKQLDAMEEERKEQRRLFREPPKTLETDQGIFQWNPDTRKWETTGFTKTKKGKEEKNIFDESKKIVQQYKDAGISRGQIEQQYKDAGKTIPLEVQKSLDELYPKPVEAPKKQGFFSRNITNIRRIFK